MISWMIRNFISREANVVLIIITIMIIDFDQTSGVLPIYQGASILHPVT